MQNTGTWNSNVAIFYLIVFCFPTVILLIKWAIIAFYEKTNTVYVEVEKPVEVEKIVYKTNTVYVDRPAKKRKAKTNSTSVERSTNQEIINGVVSGLANLGFQRVQAKKIVKDVSAGKKYTSQETLMTDCLKRI